MKGIDEDIHNIEKQFGTNLKSTILGLCSAISYTGGTKRERIIAIGSLNEWLNNEQKEERYYDGLKEFASYYETILNKIWKKESRDD